MRIDKKQFELIKPLTWNKVADIWRRNEINEKHWKKYWELKGFKFWEEWRKKYLNAYAALKGNWYLVRVKNPLKSVPNFRGGNYRGWKEKIYEGRKLPKFAEMKEHWAAAEFLKNLPKRTTIVALNTDIGIVIAEGMHRCAAITKAARGGKRFDTELYMAMLDVKKKQIPDFTKE